MEVGVECYVGKREENKAWIRKVLRFSIKSTISSNANFYINLLKTNFNSFARPVGIILYNDAKDRWSLPNLASRTLKEIVAKDK